MPSSSSSTESETPPSAHKPVVKKRKHAHSTDCHGSKHKNVKCAPPVESENSSSESEKNGDSSSSLSSSDSDNESPKVKHKESKKHKLDKTETPKSSKHHKTSSANKEHKLKIKDDKEKKVITKTQKLKRRKFFRQVQRHKFLWIVQDCTQWKLEVTLVWIQPSSMPLMNFVQ